MRIRCSFVGLLAIVLVSLSGSAQEPEEKQPWEGFAAGAAEGTRYLAPDDQVPPESSPESKPVLVQVTVDGPVIAGSNATGHVVVGWPGDQSPRSPLVITFRSSHDELRVPDSIVVAPGRNSASFDLKAKPVSRPTEVRLTARLERQISTVDVIIQPLGELSGVKLHPIAPDKHGAQMAGVIELSSAAPRGGMRFQVSVAASGVVDFEPIVMVPEGETSQVFEIRGPGLLDQPPPLVTVEGRNSAFAAFADLVLTHPGWDRVVVDGFCPATTISPDIATDGQRVYLDPTGFQTNDGREGMLVFLTGYRYNISPPRSGRPGGEGEEAIFCHCQRLEKEVTTGIDGETIERLFFTIPMNAPSAEYEMRLLPENEQCPASEIEPGECAEGCADARLFVTPAHIVTMLQSLDVDSNSEPRDNHPAEMSFTFSSLSGEPVSDGETGVAMVEFSGDFPGGFKGAGHLTHTDDTFIFADLPIYIGNENRMTKLEWDEECDALPSSQVDDCLATGTNFLTQGRFSDRFEFSFGGAEFDSSPSKWWGQAAGIGTFGLACYVGFKAGHGCTTVEGLAGSFTLAEAVSSAINDALKDDDDHLGVFSESFQSTQTGFRWTGGDGVDIQNELTEGRTSGRISMAYKNMRVGAPLIHQYRVALKSLELVHDYEESGCEPPNEVFLNSRVFLYDGTTKLPSTDRDPDDDAVFLMTEGQTGSFGAAGLTLSPPSGTGSSPLESPLLYIEIGVWERDSEMDLIGLHSETVLLADFLAGSFGGTVTNEVTPEGKFVRRVRQQRTVFANGFAGSDNHCWGIWAHGWDPDAQEGKVKITYEIDVSWLKEIAR